MNSLGKPTFARNWPSADSPSVARHRTDDGGQESQAEVPPDCDRKPRKSPPAQPRKADIGIERREATLKLSPTSRLREQSSPSPSSIVGVYSYPLQAIGARYVGAGSRLQHSESSRHCADDLNVIIVSVFNKPELPLVSGCVAKHPKITVSALSTAHFRFRQERPLSSAGDRGSTGRAVPQCIHAESRFVVSIGANAPGVRSPARALTQAYSATMATETPARSTPASVIRLTTPSRPETPTPVGCKRDQLNTGNGATCFGPIGIPQNRAPSSYCLAAIADFAGAVSVTR